MASGPGKRRFGRNFNEAPAGEGASRPRSGDSRDPRGERPSRPPHEPRGHHPARGGEADPRGGRRPGNRSKRRQSLQDDGQGGAHDWSDVTVSGEDLWDKALARAVDQISVEDLQIPDLVLMEAAGRGIADTILELEPEDAPILVLAGRGNNGGDGLVAARHLNEAGLDVHIFMVVDGPQAPSPACARQLSILAALGLATPRWREGVLRRFANDSPIVIDAVLGLGASGKMAIDGALHQALSEAATLEDATVVAVDAPSGLDVDAAVEQDIPLDADLTVTFGGRKPAHVIAPARDACGEIICLDIGFPAQARERAMAQHRPRFVVPDARALLGIDPWSTLAPSANKFDRGHVLVIGGSVGKTGAPLIAAQAALRAGAGWASVAMPASAYDSLRGEVPREVTFEQQLFDGERLNPLALERFIEERKVRAVCIGPGSVQSPLTSEIIALLTDRSQAAKLGVVLDAGATQGLADLLAHAPADAASWVATPHPGEWSRLGSDFSFTPLDAPGLLRSHAKAESIGCALLFKHATPILLPGIPGVPACVNDVGDNALARAGSGDILAGTIAAHLAMGLPVLTASLRAQTLLGLAARRASRRRGRHGVLARDLLSAIGRVSLADLEIEDEDSDDEA